LPAVDERLVVADCGFEIVEGKVVAVSPAYEPHARRHAKLAALLEACVADGYTVAVDMLTRAGPREDFAPDASIFASARDPATGGRQLEEVAFEIVSTETLAHAGAKAASLLRRGVRRVFAIDVERERGLHWSSATSGWEILGPDAVIDDPVFAAVVHVHELVSTASADDAMARALLAKRNPVIEATRAEARTEATAAAIIAVLFARGLAPTAAQQSRILSLRDPAELARCLASAATCSDIAELFGA
jgi:hypothetical protein